MTTEPTAGPVEIAREALRDVYDPELGIDVVSLGLVYDLRVQDSGLVVEMTLTTPGCPVSEQLPMEATETLRRALPDMPVRVDVVWDPPWGPERLSEEAMVSLGFRPGS